MKSGRWIIRRFKNTNISKSASRAWSGDIDFSRKTKMKCNKKKNKFFGIALSTAPKKLIVSSPFEKMSRFLYLDVLPCRARIVLYHQVHLSDNFPTSTVLMGKNWVLRGLQATMGVPIFGKSQKLQGTKSGEWGSQRARKYPFRYKPHVQIWMGICVPFGCLIPQICTTLQIIGIDTTIRNVLISE